MRETHWNILNNLLLIQNLITYSVKVSYWYILNNLLLIQKPVTYSLLTRPFSRKEGSAVINITQNAYVYFANNVLEVVVVVVNNESELLVVFLIL